jgi:SpoIID/LytB domain protein
VTKATVALAAAAMVLCGAVMFAARAQTGPAFFVRSLQNPVERRESRSDILDTPILPGSVMKAVTLVAAIESQVIEPSTARMCRRTVTVAGKTYTCSHPDVRRPLTAAEALAYSCNDFFVSLAPRLSRAAFNQMRAKLGLPPIAASSDLAASLVGLDGPRITPRTMLDVVTRLAGADAARPVALTAAARRVLLDGMRGAAEYGSASALNAAHIPALAKTGTSPMPGGGWMGMVVALTPQEKPTRAAVVVAPGAAGLDAAALAADVLQDRNGSTNRPSDSTTGSSREAQLARTVRVSINGRVHSLDLEEYVARVVAGEGQPKAADAAQQALAITVRTFALANLNRHRREGYDLCDSTHCQVLRAATEASTRAARATAGRVLARQNQPATVFYSAWCGGRSELASEVWPGAVDYSSVPHTDEACQGEPGWSSDVRLADLERALRAAGHRGDRLRNLRILQRNASGRVARLRVEGFVPNEIAAPDFRIALGRVGGWQLLKSTSFEVQRLSSGYRFTGVGYGHGVGLCVIGAGNRAQKGATVDEILAFYFPTLTVEAYRGNTSTPGSAASRGSADVLLALPSSEESERGRIIQLVRETRDEIGGKIGAKPPAVIRVTVHPTVEAFARATGQPWWVSGATDGANIDLLPLTILRQRGQVERTIRHEVAHVLIDGALKGRPLWVREGAAFYFADPNTATDVAARLTCPVDEEFLRPVSAGTHRAAYARAEACFRRAIAQGKSWSEIK